MLLLNCFVGRLNGASCSVGADLHTAQFGGLCARKNLLQSTPIKRLIQLARR